MNIFLSYPTNISAYDAMNICNDAISYINLQYGYDITIVNSMNPRDGASQRLKILANRINQMSEADAVYFCDRWEEDPICQIERQIADLYGLRVL